MPPPKPDAAGSGAISVRVVADGLERTKERVVAAGGDLGRVTIVAVTKGFGPEAARAALGAGLADIGENYADELLAKAAQIESDGEAGARWHFLGRLQRNKIPRLAPVVACWQSVGRAEEAVAIGKRSPRAQVFVEVDVSTSSGRPGCAPAEVPALVAAAVEAGCRVRGLMTVAPLAGGSEADRERAARAAFESVASMASELGLKELSMGMSADLEAAVRSGSTMVRVGTALFGERPGKDPHMRRQGLQQ